MCIWIAHGDMAFVTCDALAIVVATAFVSIAFTYAFWDCFWGACAPIACAIGIGVTVVIVFWTLYVELDV